MSDAPVPRTLVVLQPGYLPWLGFFDQLRRSDVFVYYDDVQFDRHGWRNRNRIRTPNGPLWLTVPVAHSGEPRAINEVQIDNSGAWARKHIGSLKQYYAKAPYAKRYLPELVELLSRPWSSLLDLDVASTGLMAGWLGLTPPALVASSLGIGGVRSERLIAICKHFGATRYLSGDAASEYIDVELFASHGVEVVWQNYRHPVYPQQGEPFIPYLSAIDLVLNCGDNSAAILAAHPHS